VIEGIRLELTGKELAERFAARADYHRQQAQKYRDEYATWKAGRLAQDPEMLTMSMNPDQQYRSKIEVHDRKALYFQFHAEHINPSERFDLEEGDIFKYELVER
jgi:hypothetical protein